MKRSTKAALLTPVAIAARPAYAAKNIVRRAQKNVRETKLDMEYNLQQREVRKTQKKLEETKS